MNSFTFYNPVKLHFGEDALEKLPKELAQFGQKVLVVYGGGSIKKNGVYNAVIEKLQEAGKSIFELSGVEPNPRVETARLGIEICKKEGIDLVLAVGGGSVIDCSKLIVAGAKYDGDAWDIVKRKFIVKDALPLGTVLTLAATGSEMNSGSVITNASTEEKFSWGSPAVFPKFSILNPAYTVTVPKNHTVYGIVDMMSHVFEQYFHNATNTPITDEMCEGVLRTVISTAPKLIEDLENVTLRETILLAGTIGLNGFLSIGSQGDWASHNIEHAVSAIYDIPHAGGLAILQPHWMRLNVSVNPERFAGIATRVFGVDATGKTTEEVAHEGIDRLSAFWTSLGAPNRLADYDIDDAKFNQIVEHAMENGPFGNFNKLQEKDVRTILQNAR
ncbi:iron-containing alcohol dehydrogenase [Lysinibacillus sphaericus]|uniref:NADH-dependent alcohol dehydrogenase n=1 Tax=Lysinibacillus sphaericus TaxID=1421 RepID=A0A2S0JXA1_LYSSH|nr:iron-containing alcohol dehydrogenase [Lysinibacillus sphaericus]AVK95773.1 NADH-dependent alcohol dehydrogenase [Lysinibacillus sphaericus]MED4546097.1 iron-containing alcohol dehydrogenase [Lysinibacillus sphaericus]TKI16255.1 iron-containing alcohol dehydrogenase [Lysinibacillus sphaericus]SUV18487.1 NADH-dependent butanol dehydrogenase [Lysinibacillus sphaericus]GEC82974.1 putative NADH-dependent butanol dehydrogenase 1 [Lysinibacillus sphaericus]